MNISLLHKWWFRFKDPTVSSKWKVILAEKYSKSGLEISRCSSFWSGILTIRHIVDLDINRSIGNGHSTFFWLDRWFGEYALYSIYPNLFRIAYDPHISVCDVLSLSSLTLMFNRQLTRTLLIGWL